MSVLSPLLMIVFPAAVIAAAVKDATTFTIPNWLCAAAALAFFPVALFCGLSPAGYGMALLLFVAPALVLLLRLSQQSRLDEDELAALAAENVPGGP